MFKLRLPLVAWVILTGVPLTLGEQKGGDAATLMAAQRDAMKRLSFMDGVWKGTASMHSPSDETHTFTQTERIGPFLDGTIKLIEGRGYEEDGSVNFNAFAIISYDPDKKVYNMRSYAGGRLGDYVFTPTEDGFSWEIPAGAMTIRYTATIKDGAWHEVGDRIMPDGPSIRFIEIDLRRIGSTDWPAAGAVSPE